MNEGKSTDFSPQEPILSCIMMTIFLFHRPSP